MPRSPLRRVTALAFVAAVALTSCGGDESNTSGLSPAALEGRGVMRSKGCASCHGSNGGGGVGPAFVDLFGSDVAVEITTEDGDAVTVTSTVVPADRDYLVESIVDPTAKVAKGYSLPMPKTELTQTEIDAIITYIEALAPTSTSDGADG